MHELTTREEVQIAPADEAGLVLGVTLPYGKLLHFRVPRLTLDLNEFDAKQVLVNLEDGRHDDSDREVLLHEHVVQVEALLNVLAVVVPVVPDVELAVKWEAFLLVLLLFHRKKYLALLQRDGAELLLEVCEEIVHVLRVLDHLDFSDVVGPCRVAQ